MNTLLPIVEVTRRTDWGEYVRYDLSNGWFIDRSVRHSDRGGSGKYDLYITREGQKVARWAANANRLNEILDTANRLYMS